MVTDAVRAFERPIRRLAHHGIGSTLMETVALRERPLLPRSAPSIDMMDPRSEGRSRRAIALPELVAGTAFQPLGVEHAAFGVPALKLALLQLWNDDPRLIVLFRRL